MQLECSINIKAPVEKVFHVFSDIPSIEKNLRGVTNIKLLTEGDVGVGTRWKETRIIFGQEATEEMWITSFNPAHDYTVEAESHNTHYTTTYTFEQNENQETVTTMTFISSPLSFTAKTLSIMGFLFKGSLKKALIQDMEDLKKVCEA